MSASRASVIDKNLVEELDGDVDSPLTDTNESSFQEDVMSNATDRSDDEPVTEAVETTSRKKSSSSNGDTTVSSPAAVAAPATHELPEIGERVRAGREGDPTEDTYDEVPYPGGAYRNTHPCHLAMVTRMCGIRPAPPTRCRVLELGCSMGANLIPMAQDLPESHFVGVDLSARQVKEGQAFIEELGLKNVELRHLSIADIDDSFGKFDYIICHGVYSWVPPEVQKAILDTGRKLLTSNGVLYVSYNTYPGWHLRGVVREMMKYHVAAFDNPRQQIAQARGLLDFLVKYARSRSQAYPTLLKEEAKMLEGRLDSYIYHEHLEHYNEPVYFHEFVRRAAESGVRYMADAAISSMVAQLFDESAAEILKDVPLLRREQYMDFLRSRMFRCSLLCLPENVPNYRMPSHNLLDLHVSFHQPLLGEPSANPGEVVWKHPAGKITTQAPITAAIETTNNAFPGWVAVKDLVDALPEGADKTPLLDALMVAFIRGLVQLAEEPVPICTTISEKPVCTPLARLQARRMGKVSNLLHNDFVFQPQQRVMVHHMDGTRTAEDLAEILRTAVAEGKLKVSHEEKEISAAELDAIGIVNSELQRLRALAMLAG